MRVFILICALSTFFCNSLLASDFDVLKHRVRRLTNIFKANDLDGSKKFFVKIIKSDKYNAYAMGPTVFITDKAVRKLNDSELMAVIAHEVGHIREGHWLKRSALLAGATFVALFDFNSEKKFAERLRGFFDFVNVNQELTADCHAYNWLSILESRGYDFSPKDLNSASESLNDFNFSNVGPELEEYFYDLPPFVRYQMIERGHSSDCKFD